MGDGGTTVASVLAGILGAIVAWTGVHFCRKRIKQRHLNIEREDYLKEMQLAHDVEQGRDRKQKRKSRERRPECPEWREPRPEERMPDEYAPERPVEEALTQEVMPPQEAMPPQPVRVDYIQEVDELTEVIIGLQSKRKQERACPSCSTESSTSSSSSSDKPARRMRTSDSPRGPPDGLYDFGQEDNIEPRAYVLNQRPFPAGNPPPRMPPRVSRGPRYRGEGFGFGSMPPLPQDIRRGRGRGRLGRRYGTN